MSESKTIYCGKGNKKSDDWLKITVDPDVIMQYVEEYNGKSFVRLNVNIKAEKDKYGKDVSVSVDTWKPKSSEDVPF